MGIRHIKAFQRLIDVLRLAKIYLAIWSIPSDFNPEEVMDFTKVCYIESTRERFLYLGELISSRRKEKKVIHKDGNPDTNIKKSHSSRFDVTDHGEINPLLPRD